MAAFPDALEATHRILDGLATRHGTLTMYGRLPADFEARLADGPVGLAYRAGGVESPDERVDRITVELYAPATSPGTQASQVGEDVKASLVHRYHVVEGVGVIDWVDVESVPTDVPYPTAEVGQNVATYRHTTRPD